MSEQERLNISLQREDIIAGIKKWLKEANTPFEPVIPPNIDEGDIVIQVTGRKEDAERSISKFFVVAPHDADSIDVSTFLKFQESDKIGFKLLFPPDKLTFVNILRIPLLTLNLNYTIGLAKYEEFRNEISNTRR